MGRFKWAILGAGACGLAVVVILSIHRGPDKTAYSKAAYSGSSPASPRTQRAANATVRHETQEDTRVVGTSPAGRPTDRRGPDTDRTGEQRRTPKRLVLSPTTPSTAEAIARLQDLDRETTSRNPELVFNHRTESRLHSATAILINEVLAKEGLGSGLALLFQAVMDLKPQGKYYRTGRFLAFSILRALAERPDADSSETVRFAERLLEDAPWVGERFQTPMALSLPYSLERLFLTQSNAAAEPFLRKWIPRARESSNHRLATGLIRALGQGRLPNRFEILMDLKPARIPWDDSWLEAVAYSKDPRSLPLIEKELKDPNYGPSARKLLLEFPNREVIPYLERMLEPEAGRSRYDVLTALGKHGSRVAQRDLLTALRSTDPHLAAYAAYCLCSIFKDGLDLPAGLDPVRRENTIRFWEQWAEVDFDPERKPRLRQW